MKRKHGLMLKDTSRKDYEELFALLTERPNKDVRNHTLKLQAKRSWIDAAEAIVIGACSDKIEDLLDQLEHANNRDQARVIAKNLLKIAGQFQDAVGGVVEKLEK